MAAHQGDKTINELAGHYSVHPTLIHGWKKHLVAGAEGLFAGPAAIQSASADAEARQAELFEQLGRLKMELEWIKKKLPPSAEFKRSLVAEGNAELSIRRQCELLGLSRSSFYYEPAGASADDLRVMGLIDRQYTARPSHGSRRMVVWLGQQGEEVNRAVVSYAC